MRRHFGFYSVTHAYLLPNTVIQDDLGVNSAVLSVSTLLNPANFTDDVGISKAQLLLGVKLPSTVLQDDLGVSSAALTLGTVSGNPEFVNAGAYTAAPITNSQAIVPLPASVTSGNLLIMWWTNTSNQVTMNDPAGWTRGGNVGPNTIGCWWWRKADGTEGSNVTITWGMNAVSWRAQILQYRGQHTTSPIGNVNGATGTNNTLTAAALTASGNKSTMVLIMSQGVITSGVPTATGWTSDQDITGSSGSAEVDHKNLTNTGDSSGSTSVTTGGSSRWYTFMIELKAP